MLTSNDSALHIDFLRQLNKCLARKFEETLRANNTTPVQKAETCCSFAQPFLISYSSAMPDDAGVVDVELLAEAVDA